MWPVQYHVCIYIKARHLGGGNTSFLSPVFLPLISLFLCRDWISPLAVRTSVMSNTRQQARKRKKRVKKEYPGNGGDTRFFFFILKKEIPCGEIFQLRPGRQRPPSENTFFFFLGINRPICYASSSSSLATLSSKGG